MAKIISFIMAIFTALYMFVSCGKIPGTGGRETSTAPETTVMEPVRENDDEETPSDAQPQLPVSTREESTTEETQVNKALTLKISGREVPVTWENNDSVTALSELSSDGLTVNMSMYGGFEQVGERGYGIVVFPCNRHFPAVYCKSQRFTHVRFLRCTFFLCADRQLRLSV